MNTDKLYDTWFALMSGITATIAVTNASSKKRCIRTKKHESYLQDQSYDHNFRYMILLASTSVRFD